jgi:hypothetical protein
MGDASIRQHLLSSTLPLPARPPSPATNAVASTVRQSPAVTIDIIKEAMDRVGTIRHGLLIGDWMGCEVYVDDRVPAGQIVVVDPATNKETMRFRVDHPLLAGTKMQAAARAYLGPSPPSSTTLSEGEAP